MYCRSPSHRPPVWGTTASSPHTTPPIPHAVLDVALHSSITSVTSVRSNRCRRKYIFQASRDTIYLLYARSLLSHIPSTCMGRTIPK